MSIEAGHIFEFGPFRLDGTEHRLLRGERPVALAPKVFETLLLLVERSGHVVEKDEIMKAIWPDSFVEEANLTQYVFALRRALGEAESGEPYIETVPKHGYRFVADVKRIDGENTGSIIENSPANQVSPDEDGNGNGQVSQKNLDVDPRRDTLNAVNWKRRSLGFALGAVFLGFVLASYYVWDASTKTGTAVGVRSIAVLPFKSIDKEADGEQLGMGMTDAFINRLGNIRQIDVRPTRAIVKYNGNGDDSLAAGRELKVDAVLDGSVHRADDRIRVTVQLLRVRDGAALWSDKFDAKFTDIFTVQDSISERVAQALALTLNVEERKGLGKRSTNNAEAYQAYLKGRYFWNRRTAESYQKAIAYFDQAVSLDPQYAQAHAGLADTYILLGSMANAFLTRRESMHRARSSAMKALEIDDTLAEAHTSLAFVKVQHDWDWPGADREFKRAIELNPNYATARHWYAYYYAAVGHHDESIREIRRAHEIDPLSLIISTDVADMYYLAGRYDEAIEQCQKTLEMDPNFSQAHHVLALSYAQKGMHANAINELQKAAGASGDGTNILASLGYSYAMSGRKDEARKVLGKLKALSVQSYVPFTDIATVHASLGEKDEAFAWLEKAYEDRSGTMLLLNAWPLMDPLRSDPRFSNLIQRIGLSP